MSSEQPESFGEMSRRDAEGNFRGLIYGGIAGTFRIMALRKRLEGGPISADTLEQKAEEFELMGILERSGVRSDLRKAIPRGKQDSEIIDGEIIETRKELE